MSILTWRMRVKLLTFGVMLALSTAGCQRPADEHVFRQAQQFCQLGEWDKAVGPLKTFLLDHPRDAASHFHLGRCYLNGSSRRLGAAEGELLLALDLFLQDGRHSPITEFSDTYYEFRCHLELAKVYLHGLLYAVAVRTAPSTIHELVTKCQRAAKSAEGIIPGSDDVKQLNKYLEDIGRMRTPPPPRLAPRQPFSA